MKMVHVQDVEENESKGAGFQMIGMGIGALSMGPVYAVAGAAFVSKFIEDFMMDAGRGNWVWLIKTIMYVLVGVYALNTWYSGVRAIAAIFGVMVP